jgi:two-component system, chemotaxis family, sensor kinase CheA
MAIDISQFYPVFFEETKEHLAEMEQLLLKLRVDAPDYDQMNAIFRAAHSIKGGSATFGFDDMASVTHVLESLLDKLRKKEMALQAEMIDVFLQVTDVIKEQLSCHIEGTVANPAPADAISHKLLSLITSTSKEQTAKEDESFGFFGDEAQAKTSDDSFGFFDDAEESKESDDGFGLFEPVKPAATKTKPPKALTNTPKNTKTPAVAKTVTAKNIPTPAIAAAPEPAAPVIIERRSADRVDAESTTIRVDVNKVDKLINLVGELVITEAMLTQALSNAPAALLQALSSSLAQLERNTRDLQESVMSIRMMPISFVFSRFPRMVRDLTQKLNKEVELITIGEDTELDKGLIERIADPLTHLVRNSLDHGIESPKARKAAGKPAKGKITLSATHQGGNIVIEVADDGAGLNRERILNKAKLLGISVPVNISDNDLWNVICEPGFSTAESITDVSGRGVGMDVVNRNITEMGGQISVSSVAGQGCKISIQLPLTLAILDGMTVSLGENLFVIPLNSIIETMQPKSENIKSVTGEGAMVHTRGEYLPIIAMHKAFNIATQVTDATKGMLVIVEAQGKKAALLFDDLVGQQQVVIKSLETNFRKVIGVSGATILGDGTVALIVDVPTMMKLGQTTSSNQRVDSIKINTESSNTPPQPSYQRRLVSR